MKFLLLLWLIGWGVRGCHLGQESESRETAGQVLLGPLHPGEKILQGYKLDLNRLSASDWELLPNIGPAISRRIVAWQRQHGPFANIDALTQVPGIGPKTVEGVRQFFDTPTP